MFPWRCCSFGAACDIQPLPMALDLNVPGPYQWMLTSAHRRAEALVKRVKHMQASLTAAVKPALDSGAIPEVRTSWVFSAAGPGPCRGSHVPSYRVG